MIVKPKIVKIKPHKTYNKKYVIHSLKPRKNEDFPIISDRTDISQI